MIDPSICWAIEQTVLVNRTILLQQLRRGGFDPKSVPPKHLRRLSNTETGGNQKRDRQHTGQFCFSLSH